MGVRGGIYGPIGESAHRLCDPLCFLTPGGVQGIVSHHSFHIPPATVHVPFFRRKKKNAASPSDAPIKRPPITGTIQVAGRAWTVREEKRQGPRTQILILTAEDTSDSEMHIRPNPGNEAQALEDVEPLAFDPLYRWFSTGDTERWEARLLVSEDTGAQLIKFICWGIGVFEGTYPFSNGLGFRSDDELRQLLDDMRTAD